MAPSPEKSVNDRDRSTNDDSSGGGGGGSKNDRNGNDSSGGDGGGGGSRGDSSSRNSNNNNNNNTDNNNNNNNNHNNNNGNNTNRNNNNSNTDNNNNRNTDNGNNNNNHNRNNNAASPNSGRDNNGSGNVNGNDNGNGKGNGNRDNRRSNDSSGRDSSRSSGNDKDGVNSEKSSKNSQTSSSDNSSNDRAIIIGVVVGVGVLIIIIVAICVICCRRKKKKAPHQDPARYFPNNPDPKGQQSPYNNQWYNSSDAGSSGAMPPGGWAMPPPPPHMMSGDMSGGYSSGPGGPPMPPPNPGLSLGFSKSLFTYDELAAATQGFAQANVLGQGGFGFVHKGVLPNRKEVAVKSLKSGSGQGEREFQAEVEIISRVHHTHLVSLVGYCIGAGGQRMLVYEFVPNKTLEFHLHGKGQPVMDFETRHKIALGSAKGLAYLHEDCHPRIIHRDIKTANILIDYTFEAKVADFGLAKLSSDTYSHVSTRVMGTFGYLAPEYAASGKLTDKSDVFSYGVMLLELITGRRPINPTGDEDSLVDWARPQLMRVLDEKRFEGVVDPRLETNFSAHEMTRMVACAAASIRHSAKRRPKMSQIVRALEGDLPLDALNGEGSIKPGQSTYFGAGTGGNNTTEYDANSYKEDMKKFMTILNEDDYTSSEYTSSNEYGTRNYK